MILVYSLLTLISIQSLNFVSLIVLGVGAFIKYKKKYKWHVLFIVASIAVILVNPLGSVTGSYANYSRTHKKIESKMKDSDFYSAKELMDKLDDKYGESDYSNLVRGSACSDESSMKKHLSFVENKTSSLYYQLALNCYKEDDKNFYDTAIKAADKYPNSYLFNNCAGCAEFDLGNLRRAEYYLLRADRLCKSMDGNVQGLLGLCMYYNSEYDLARECFDNAMKLGVDSELESKIDKCIKDMEG